MKRSTVCPLLLTCLAGALIAPIGYLALNPLHQNLYARPIRAASTFEWRTTRPESEGMSEAKLDALKDVLAARKTKAFLVVRNDKIVYEWYASDHSASKLHGTASLAKAVVGGMSLG